MSDADGMRYDPIQGQCQRHKPFKVGYPAIFNSSAIKTSSVLERDLTVSAAKS